MANGTNKLKPTRWEALLEITKKEDNAYKATENAALVVASLGNVDKDGTPTPVWEASLGAISIRGTEDPRALKAKLSDALRKAAAAIDSTEL